MNNAVLNSWEKNARAWNTIIEGQSIPSRKYTNEAILGAIKSFGLQKVADLGCGEGWLCREMTKNQIEAIGFDGTAQLIEVAKAKGSERYYSLQFEQIVEGQPLPNAPFNGAVFNFSLYSKDGLNLLFQEILNALDDNGILFIQTLHPFYLMENGFGYRSQWLQDSWHGLPGNFKDGHSWYARTMEDWMDLISKVPRTSFEIKEVIDREEKPLSLLITIIKENA